jgi:Dirigent-like protein
MTFTRRLRAAAVACGIVATAGLTMAVVGEAQPQQGPPTGTLRLLQRNREAKFHFIDVPPLQGVRRTPTPGDGAVITGPMRDSAGGKAGRLQAIFTFTRPKRGEIQVSATFVLRDGRISVSGAETNARTDDFAVSGGTGRYAGARGTLRVTDGKRSTAFVFTFMG